MNFHTLEDKMTVDGGRWIKIHSRINIWNDGNPKGLVPFMAGL